MRHGIGLAAALLAPTLPVALGQHVRDLSSVQWSLSSRALNRTVPAEFPSQVHLDLLRAGVIGKYCWKSSPCIIHLLTTQ